MRRQDWLRLSSVRSPPNILACSAQQSGISASISRARLRSAAGAPRGSPAATRGRGRRGGSGDAGRASSARPRAAADPDCRARRAHGLCAGHQREPDRPAARLRPFEAQRSARRAAPAPGDSSIGSGSRPPRRAPPSRPPAGADAASPGRSPATGGAGHWNGARSAAEGATDRPRPAQADGSRSRQYGLPARWRPPGAAVRPVRASRRPPDSVPATLSGVDCRRASPSLLQRCRDVVAIPSPGAPLRRRGRHRLAFRIEEATGQRRTRGLGQPVRAAPDLGIETLLHGVEELARDDRLVQARMALVAMRDLAEVDAVAQEMEECTLG